MASRDNPAIVIDPRNGLWARGECPPDHMQTLDNCEINQDGVAVRPGFVTQVAPAFAVGRFHQYRLASAPATQRYLFMKASGTDIYDSGFSLVTPILSISGITDFSVFVHGDRAYITPHNRVRGTANEFVYVWDPALMSTARRAAGDKPTGTFTVAQSATAGNCEIGLHILAVHFVTNTGFITPPALYQQLTLTAKRKISLTAIPTGPTGTVSRHISMSKVVTQFDGNAANPHLYFVKEIADNTTTVLADAIDAFDSQLVSSYDYLKNVRERIPAGVFINGYLNRMVVGGESPITGFTGVSGNIVRVSDPGLPEVFKDTDGFLTPPFEGGGVKNSVELNGKFYFMKSGMTMSTNDNGQPPNAWPIIVVDGAIGTECFGISRVPWTPRSPTRNACLVIDRAGLFIFDGNYSQEPLTWKIQDIWDAVGFGDVSRFQIIYDTLRSNIHLSTVDIGGIAYLYTGDISDGLDPRNIHWSRWPIKNGNVYAIAIDLDSNLMPTLMFTTNIDSAIYRMARGFDDGGQRIGQTVKTGAQLFDLEGNRIRVIGLKVRVNGGLDSGNVDRLLHAEDPAADTTLAQFSTVGLVNKREFWIQTNVIGTRVAATIKSATIAGGNFYLYKIVMFAKPEQVRENA